MEAWLERWLRWSPSVYLVAAVVGLLATLLWASPGTRVLGLGPLSLDVYYLTLGAFGLLFALSLTRDSETDVYHRESRDETD